MGKLLEFIKNKEPLKLVILEYGDKIIDIISYSDDYYNKHWQVFKRNKDKGKITNREFFERLNNFIYIEKISELLIILYLEDLKGSYPTIYELNKLLKRTPLQYSATFKEIAKLKKLDIVHTKPVIESSRKEKRIYLNKSIVTLYGDDEFRQMMLDEWEIDAKEYIKMKLKDLQDEKEKFERMILMVKKGKRMKKKND